MWRFAWCALFLELEPIKVYINKIKSKSVGRRSVHRTGHDTVECLSRTTAFKGSIYAAVDNDMRACVIETGNPVIACL